MTVIAVDGEVILQEEVTTLENGFFEIWLPRNIEATIYVEFEGLSSMSTISTYSGDPTCITTIKLS